MKVLMLFILLFSQYLFAEEPIKLTKVSTEFILEADNYPSCMLFKHRAIEREKVLREMSFASKNNPYYKDIFFVNGYLMNKYFLDMNLWDDETVVVKTIWQLTPELMSQIKQRQKESYFWLKGDGIDWIERWDFFPEEVHFEWNDIESQLITTHKTYYVDYCSPREESQLYWHETGYEDFWSTKEEIDEFLNFELGEMK